MCQLPLCINSSQKSPFSSIPFTISGTQSKEAGKQKIITFDYGDYLNM